ncbi:hypothetical protein GIB67_030101 [Kingdonia uniflora]|uniref:ATP-dependent DNA helicase n=1 Tax=Kingdonia uniflora TaxID=39325 RepID=A0A7J7L2F2_9MAGN|nr:hypothetical protein GIB67_030101 [Kingdonia uniflora]
MRLIDNSSENVAFPHTLLEIGSNPKETVELPAAFNKCANLDELICSVYPHLEEVTTASTTYLTERMILSARNEDVNIINIQAMAKIQGQEIVYLAADKLSEADADDRTVTNRYPQEYMNSLDHLGNAGELLDSSDKAQTLNVKTKRLFVTEPPEGCTFLDGLEVRVAFGNVWKQPMSELSGGQRSLLALSLILACIKLFSLLFAIAIVLALMADYVASKVHRRNHRGEPQECAHHQGRRGSPIMFRPMELLPITGEVLNTGRELEEMPKVRVKQEHR